MTKKKKRLAPASTLAPIELTKDEFSYAMLRLLKNQDFKLLRSRWLNLRYDLLETGKEKRQADQWAVLSGFDAAVMEPEKWAARSPRRRDQQEAPTSDLEGGES